MPTQVDKKLPFRCLISLFVRPILQSVSKFRNEGIYSHSDMKMDKTCMICKFQNWPILEKNDGRGIFLGNRQAIGIQKNV